MIQYVLNLYIFFLNQDISRLKTHCEFHTITNIIEWIGENDITTTYCKNYLL